MQISKSQLSALIHASACQAAEAGVTQGLSDCVADALLAHFSIQHKHEDIDNYTFPSWMKALSFQMQSVLMLATRGPDGVRKAHPSKMVHSAYRATVLRAAARQRFLHWGEEADSFMTMHVIGDESLWRIALDTFFDHVDELPHHYVSHLAHAAQIIHYKHPAPAMREAWGQFYFRWVEDAHLEPEPETIMDRRLNDWDTAKDRLGKMGFAFENDFGIDLLCGCGCEDEPEAAFVAQEIRTKPEGDEGVTGE